MNDNYSGGLNIERKQWRDGINKLVRELIRSIKKGSKNIKQLTFI